MGTPPRETHNVPRRTNDHESGEYATDPGRKGDVVLAGLCTGHTGPLNGVAWSSDGSLLATVGDDHTCVIWNPHTGDPVATLIGHTDAVNRVAWSPDDRRLATVSHDGTCIIWNPHSAERLLTLADHTDIVMGVAWHPDGTRLVTVSCDGTGIVWDSRTGRPVMLSPATITT